MPNKMKIEFKCELYRIFLWGIFFLAISIVAFFCYVPLLENFLTDKILFMSHEINNKSIEAIKDLAIRKQIFLPDVVFNNIISFYETLISFLLGLLALLGFLGFLYIRLSYKKDIEQQVQLMIESKEISNQFKDVIKLELQEEIMDGIILNYETTIINLENRIAFLENVINNQENIIITDKNTEPKIEE